MFTGDKIYIEGRKVNLVVFPGVSILGHRDAPSHDLERIDFLVGG